MSGESTPTNRDAMLRDIAEAKVNAAAYSGEVGLWLPHGAKFGGMFYHYPDEGLHLVMGYLSVPEAIQRAGVATRLVSALGYIAKLEEVSSFSGYVTSPVTVKTMRTVFGSENIQYRSKNPQSGLDQVIPLTDEQAMGTIDRLGKEGISAVINIDAVPISRLEAPVICLQI